MPAIHIRDIPEELIDSLKRRAARNQRSLQKELRHILLSIVREGPPSEPLPPIKLKFSEADVATDWRREEVYMDDGR